MNPAKAAPLGLGLAALVAACAGNGVVPGVSGAPVPQRAVHARVTVIFPHPARHGEKRHRYDPFYVSASTQSVKFSLTAVNGGSVPAGFTTSTTVSLLYHGSNTSCTYASAAQTYTCTTAWTVPAAQDAFSVSAYSGTNATGNLLSTNALTQTVAAGSSNIAVTLWGVPASIAFASTSGSVIGTTGAGFLLPVGATSYPFTVVAKDKSGNAIVGAGAPSYTVTLSPATSISLTTPAPSATAFTLKELSTTSYGTATMTATAVYPTGGPTPYPQTCPSASCSVSTKVAIGEPLLAANGNSDTLSGYTAALGAAVAGTGGSAAATISTGSNPQALAFDASGNLFVAAGSLTGGSNVVDVYSKADVISALDGGSSSITGKLTTQTNPDALAFDSSGNLYVANYNSSTVSVYTAAQVAQAVSGSTGITQAGSLSTGSEPIAMAFDASGDLFVANYGADTVSAFAPAKLASAVSGSTSVAASGSLATGSAPWFVAVDGSGDLFVTNSASNTVSAYKKATLTTALSGSTGVAATGTLATGSGPYGIVANSSGDLFVTNSGSGTASAYKASAVTSALGGSTGVAATGSLTTLSGPQAVKLDAYGNLFVADDSTGGVSVFSASAVSSALAGSSGVAETSYLAGGYGTLALLFGT